nr:lysophospholipid acyltransferase family protein [Leptospira perolatii]
MLHPGSSNRVRRTIDAFGRIYSALFYKVEVHGLENIPKDGEVLLLAKHARNDDIPIGLSHALFRRRWNCWGVMKDSLARPRYLDFFLKCGGIPLNRDEPSKSKKHLLFAREVLYRGNLMVIFPEQTTVPYEMGEGKSGAFRFIVGKPKKPLPVSLLGFEYEPRGRFRRTKITLRVGETRELHPGQDPEEFLHECMHELARLSGLVYPFERETNATLKEMEGIAS